MEFATSKELRLNAGKMLRNVKSGQRFVITYRGKPVALLVPFDNQVTEEMPSRSYEEAWEDIEQTLSETEAEYSDWTAAIKESRRQP